MDSVIALLSAAEIRYVVIGGQAIRLHGLPRFSMDWDLFIPARDQANLERLASKRATNRPQDQQDILFLEQLINL